MKKLIILDRDGVINIESEFHIRTPEEWIPIPGSLEAIVQLNKAGYVVVVVTNQSGIARGYLDIKTLDRIHQKMFAAVENLGGKIQDVFYCPHGPDDNCNCRKPKTGLFEQISQKYHHALKNVPMVGDTYRDVVAAQAMQCDVMLVKTGYGLITLEKHPDLKIPVFENLAEAVKVLLKL